MPGEEPEPKAEGGGPPAAPPRRVRGLPGHPPQHRQAAGSHQAGLPGPPPWASGAQWAWACDGVTKWAELEASAMVGRRRQGPLEKLLSVSGFKKKKKKEKRNHGSSLGNFIIGTVASGGSEG